MTLMTMISAATPRATAPTLISRHDEDEPFAFDREQVSLRDGTLVPVQDHSVSLASADSTLSSWLLPR